MPSNSIFFKQHDELHKNMTKTYEKCSLKNSKKLVSLHIGEEDGIQSKDGILSWRTNYRSESNSYDKEMELSTPYPAAEGRG